MKRLFCDFLSLILLISYLKAIQVGSVEKDLVKLITLFSIYILYLSLKWSKKDVFQKPGLNFEILENICKKYLATLIINIYLLENM